MGTSPAEPVAAVGQYSLRGGIVDVFPPEAEWPFRLEFFGDQLESVREFDPTTQRSRKPVPRALLLPLSEAQRSPKFFERLVRVLTLRAREHAQARGTPLPEREPEWAAEHTNTFPGWEFFVPLVEPHPHTLFSLLERPVLVWDELLDRRAQIPRTLESLTASFEEIRDIVPPRPEPREVYLTEAELLPALEGVAQISLKELSFENLAPAAETSSQAVVIGGDLYFPPEGGKDSGEWPVASGESKDESHVASDLEQANSEGGDVENHKSQIANRKLPGNLVPRSPDSPATAQNDGELENRKSQIANHQWPAGPMNRWSDELILLSQPPPKYQGRVKELVEDLRVRVKRGESVIFVVPTSGKVDRLREILKDYEIPYDRVNDGIGSSNHRAIESSKKQITQSPDGPMARWPDQPMGLARFRPGAHCAG